MIKFFRSIAHLSAMAILMASIMPCSAAEVSSRTVTTDIAQDGSLYIHNLLEDMQGEQGSTITFEKGVYHFYPEKASEKFCFISNHNDKLSRIIFNIEDVDGLTIDGQGSTFIMHGVAIPFNVDKSENVTIKNLTIDWAEPFHSECKVIANDTANGTFDIEIPEQYPYEIRNGVLTFVQPYYTFTIGQSILFDPELNATAFNTELSTPITTMGRVDVKGTVKPFTYLNKIDPNSDYIKTTGLEHKVFAEELSKGVVRISGHKKEMPEVGMILVSKGEHGLNRYAPAVRCNEVDNFLAENVIVHHACAMGFLFEHSSDVTLKSCQVVPAEGRIVSTTADATHFVGCRGKISLIDCTLRNQLDDAANFHGAYQEVVEVLGEKMLGIRVGHFQQKGFVLGYPGDNIGVVRLSDSFDPYANLTVKQIRSVNSRYYTIEFEEAVPEKIKAGDLLENLSAYPEVLVEGCTIAGNRARGLLLSTPRRAVVRNNTFSTEMEAILIPVESGFWYESGGVADLLISNNKFINSMTAGFNRGVIRFVTDDDNANIAFRNVEISDNEFSHYDNLLVEAANVEGLVIEGNTFKATTDFPQQYPDSPVFEFKHSKDVIFKGNKYKGTAKKMIEATSDMKPLKFK